MIVSRVRFEVRLISSAAFAQYMAHRGLTVRQLAEKVGGPQHRSIVGHLRSGQRVTCKPALARKLERALDAPAGSLFVPRLSTVSRETGRAA